MLIWKNLYLYILITHHFRGKIGHFYHFLHSVYYFNLSITYSRYHQPLVGYHSFMMWSPRWT